MPARKHAGVSEQWKASQHRWDDARALMEKGRWRWAMYTAGYVVECRLKTKLMRRWKCVNLQQLESKLQRRDLHADLYTHSLMALLGLSHGRDRLSKDAELWRRFKLVNRWQPAWRYSPNPSNQTEAAVFMTAVKEVVHWIDVNL